MDILLTFTGFHDPYSEGVIAGQSHPGPILSLLGSKKFDRVFLFKTPSTVENTAQTKNEIAKLHKAIKVDILDINLPDPTEYEAILKGIRAHFNKIDHENESADYFISVASGTPQMHVCWFMLAASGEIPAKILHVRPPRFATAKVPMVAEIDVTTGSFPQVRFTDERTPEIAVSETPAMWAYGRKILGEHPGFLQAFRRAAKVAPINTTVLILGETGTGKELCARFIHEKSGRPLEKFVAVNCAEIEGPLMESSLFGHVKGAFTGAVTDKKGLFDEADKGTLFLDELGELPKSSQAKLLRVIQDGEIRPVGGTNTHKVDVRIAAATNRDLKRMIKDKEFREDLYRRMNTFTIQLPPLRERRSDIPRLAGAILERFNGSVRQKKQFSADAIKTLRNHYWRGNFRELEQVVESSAFDCEADIIRGDDLSFEEGLPASEYLENLPEPFEGFDLKEFIETVRHRMIMKALARTDDNQRKAEPLLGMTSANISKHLKTKAAKKSKV